jgi:hypothetical protein
MLFLMFHITLVKLALVNIMLQFAVDLSCNEVSK